MMRLFKRFFNVFPAKREILKAINNCPGIKENILYAITKFNGFDEPLVTSILRKLVRKGIIIEIREGINYRYFPNNP